MWETPEPASGRDWSRRWQSSVNVSSACILGTRSRWIWYELGWTGPVRKVWVHFSFFFPSFFKLLISKLQPCHSQCEQRSHHATPTSASQLNEVNKLEGLLPSPAPSVPFAAIAFISAYFSHRRSCRPLNPLYSRLSWSTFFLFSSPSSAPKKCF